MSVLRCVCFTINNYTIDDFIRLAGLDCRYLIVGAEVAETGTRHLQGYVEFGKSIRFKKIKELLGDRAHIEQRRGTQDQAARYCRKDDDYYEIGEMGKRGVRTDLDNVRTVALDGGMREVTAIANLQGIRVAEKFLELNEEVRDWKPEVIWLWGETGTGKSRKAREMFKDCDYYCKNDGTKWWSGYDAHECVIIDDFRDSWFTITEMLSLLDRYEKKVEYKGGYRQFLAKRIIITSAFPPADCYKGTGEAINQLLRRVDTVTKVVAEVPVAEVGEVILELSDYYEKI